MHESRVFSSDKKGAVLVTGGAGFIGSHVCARLIEEGERVIVIDNFNDYYDPQIKRRNIAEYLRSPLCELYEGDVQDQPLLEKVFERENVDRVIHLAARAGVRHSLANPMLYEQVNGVGTIGLLDLAARKNVKNFIFGSSSSVYGRDVRAPFSESVRSDRPISPYAATKRAGELMAYTYHHLYGLPVTSLRFFTVYGPRQRPDMAIHKFARCIDEGWPIALYGRGQSVRDYTYISDIVDAIWRALKHPLGYEIINLGSAQTTRLADLIHMLEHAFGRKAVIENMNEQLGDVPVTWADISKAEQLLGWKPQVDFREGIRRFAVWYRAQQKKHRTELAKVQ